MSTHEEAVADIKKAKSVLEGAPARGKFFTHTSVSLAKSLIRILAGFGLMFGFIIFAGMALVFAEILGIVEELV